MLIKSIRGNKGERQDDEKSRNNGKDGIPHRPLHHGIVAQNHFLEGTHDVVDAAPYVFSLQGLIRLENQREALKIYVQPEDEEMNDGPCDQTEDEKIFPSFTAALDSLGNFRSFRCGKCRVRRFVYFRSSFLFLRLPVLLF